MPRAPVSAGMGTKEEGWIGEGGGGRGERWSPQREARSLSRRETLWAHALHWVHLIQLLTDFSLVRLTQTCPPPAPDPSEELSQAACPRAPPPRLAPLLPLSRMSFPSPFHLPFKPSPPAPPAPQAPTVYIPGPQLLIVLAAPSQSVNQGRVRATPSMTLSRPGIWCGAWHLERISVLRLL